MKTFFRLVFKSFTPKKETFYMGFTVLCYLGYYSMLQYGTMNLSCRFHLRRILHMTLRTYENSQWTLNA
jgi:hypothetical protein